MSHWFKIGYSLRLSRYLKDHKHQEKSLPNTLQYNNVSGLIGISHECIADHLWFELYVKMPITVEGVLRSLNVE